MAGLKETRHDLADDIRSALGADMLAAGVDVYPYDPRDFAGTGVTVQTARISPTGWGYMIRLYVDADQPEGQDLLDDLAEAVELSLSGAFPRTVWTWVFDDQRGRYLMQTMVEPPREDF